MAMAPIDAAKIFLGYLLYCNASVKEREAGLYESPIQNKKELDKAVAILKECRLPPEDIIDDLPGGYMMYAAVSAARRW
jgi:hypothetical protein